MFIFVIAGTMLFLLATAPDAAARHVIKVAFLKGLLIPLILITLLVIYSKHEYTAQITAPWPKAVFDPQTGVRLN